ncbi:MAG: hypothetical protein AB7H96_08080 [Vicinamibacterales bacterium]
MPVVRALHLATERVSPVRLAALLLLVGLAWRAALATALGWFTQPPASEMYNVARALAAGDGFADPDGAASGPTAHVAPVYPLAMSLLLRVVPEPSVPVLLTCVSILAASTLWALVPMAGRALGLPARAALLAGVIGALSPLRYLVELNGAWDTATSALGLMLLTTLTCLMRDSWTRGWRPLLLGALWGLMCLLQPASLLVGFACAITFAEAGRDTPAAMRGLALVALAFTLVLAPWTARNSRAFGGLMFVRGNLGVELSVSNNDGAQPTYRNTWQNPLARHPHHDPAEFARRNALGERRYNAVRMDEAIAWIRTHPSRFIALTAQRVRLFWLPERGIALLTLLEWLLAFGALAGLITLFAARSEAAPLFALTWLLFPALYYIVQADERYRYPIEWSLTMAAGGALHRFLPRGPA